ncbi:hypothetical protein [Tardiphaga sp. P5_C10]
MPAITTKRKATMTKSLVLIEYLASTNVFLGGSKAATPVSRNGGCLGLRLGCKQQFPVEEPAFKTSRVHDTTVKGGRQCFVNFETNTALSD